MRDFKEVEPVNLTDGLIKGSMSTQKSIEEMKAELIRAEADIYDGFYKQDEALLLISIIKLKNIYSDILQSERDRAKEEKSNLEKELRAYGYGDMLEQFKKEKAKNEEATRKAISFEKVSAGFGNAIKKLADK